MGRRVDVEQAIADRDELLRRLGQIQRALWSATDPPMPAGAHLPPEEAAALEAERAEISEALRELHREERRT